MKGAGSMRWAFATFVAILASTLAFVACTPERPQLTGDTTDPTCTVDNDKDGFGVGCSRGADCDDNDPKVTDQCRRCLNNEPGCACPTEGKRIECGKVQSRVGDQVTCLMGGQVCLDGKWSECTPGAYGPGHNGFITTKALGTAGPVGQCGDCDPNCRLIRDTPDGLDAGPDSGLLPDGGWVWNTPGGGPTPAEYELLNDGGAFDGGIFKVLLPGQTSGTPDPVNVVDPRPAGGDVYFLVDDTSSMGPVAAALRDSIATTSGQPCVDDIDPVTNQANGKKAAPGGGIVENLKCKFGNDVFIGLGRFEDYYEYAGRPVLPTSPAESLPYQHILSMQADASPAQNAAVFFGNTAYVSPPGPPGGASLRTGGDIPESMVPALYSAMTGLGLQRTNAPSFWVPPRSSWTTPWTATSLATDLVPGGCPGGLAGYPCFRPRTTPIFVVMTDAPSHNGPGGQYAYPQYSMGFGANGPWTTGAAYSPRATEAPNAGQNPPVAKTFATANELQYETDATGAIGLLPRLYWGTVTPNNGYGGGSNPPTWPSNSQARGGVVDYASNGNNGKRSTRDCTGTTSVTITNAAAATNDFGNHEIPWPEAQYIRPPQTLACGGVTYATRCGTGNPYVSAQTDAASYGASAYSGVATTFDNVRILRGGSVSVIMDGNTLGDVPIVVPDAGTRVEFRLTITDDAQISPPNAQLVAGQTGSTTGDLSLTANARNAPQQGLFYTTAANRTVRFSLRSSTPQVIVRVEYWIRPPTPAACPSGIITRSNSNPPRCLTCANGYAANGALTQCCGADDPQCGGGTVFSSSNQAGGCPDPGASVPQAARTRGAQFVGNCFSCAAFPPSTEPNAPPTVRQVGGAGVANPGCYVPSCATAFSWPPGAATTAGGVGWAFASGNAIAPNGSGKCVLTDPSALTCVAGTAPICTNFSNLCNPYNEGVPVARVTGGTSTLCGCSQMDGAALEDDHPLPLGGPVPANGVQATYFGTAPANNSHGWSVPLATRYENNVDMSVNGIPVPVPGVNLSARWTGRVRAPCTGTFQFTTYTDDGARLWINDQLVVNDPTSHGAADWVQQDNGWQNTPPVSFNLTLNQTYNMKMEMFQGGGGVDARLRWRYLSGTCAAASNLGAGWQTVPSAFLTPNYAPPNAPGSVAQCRTQGSYAVTTTQTRTLGVGGWNAESIYRFTVPAGKQFYYHFALHRNDQSNLAATVSDTSSGTFLYLKRESEIASDDTQVLDCNRSSTSFSADARNPRPVMAEINGRVGPGTYYLVVDNASGSVTAYNYVLQVNQFDEAPPKVPTAPTYKQLAATLLAQNARLIGLENSGVSCSEANLASFAQYETREHLEKLAFDTGSVDANGNPIVVSLKRDARSCGRDPYTGVTEAVVNPPDSMTRAVNTAVNTLANTLRQDLVIRATRTGAAPSPDIDPANNAFVAEDFVADVTADPSTTGGRCGSPPNNPTLPAVGPDFDPSFVAPRTRQMFNACLPGAPVRFNVRFTVPASITRTAFPQYFRFDLAVAAVGRDANGNRVVGNELARIPVVIKVPEAGAGTSALVRDYDARDACPPDTQPRWDGFGYNSYAPSAILGSDSKIEFFWSTADTPAGLATPGSPQERLFAVSTQVNVSPSCSVAIPARTEVCDKTNLSGAILAAGEKTNRRYFRIHMKLSMSPDMLYAPTLVDWKMFLDCVPAE